MFTRCLSVCACALLLGGCERETRRFADLPRANAPVRPVPMSGLQPGPHTAEQADDAQAVAVESRYLNNAFEMARGKQLFTAFNCNGCHGMGGGGMGPPLIDEKWIYGGEPAAIFTTIVRGRPNGMPAFGTKLGPQQIWQLVAYVRSMSGKVRLDVAPGRSDHMHALEPEAMRAHEP